MFKISNLFPFNKVAAAKTASIPQQVQKFDISMQAPLKEDTFVKSETSQVPQNSVVTETIDNSKDTTYNENKDVKSSKECETAGVVMSEKKITDEDINKKLAELYMVGITEPEYAKTEVSPGEDFTTKKIESFYDSNDVLRKKVVTAVAGYVSSVTLFDEEARETYFVKRTFENDSVPMLHIAKYYTSYENDSVSKSWKYEDYKISELDI